VILTIGALILGIAGILTTLLVAKRVEKRSPPKSWRATQGTIVDSEEWEASVNDQPIPAARAHIKYEVEGRIYFHQHHWTYRMGAPQSGIPITVYYDPVRPQRSWIETYGTSSNITILLYLTLFISIGIIAFSFIRLF